MAAGEGGGGNHAVLKIPVQDDEWQAFLSSFAEYQKKLSEQGSAWSNTNAGIRQMGNAFESAEETFDDLVSKAESQKLNKAFASIDKSSKETAKSWVNISKTIEKSAKDMAGLVRGGSKFSGLMGFLGLGGAAIGAGTALFGATTAADNSLASQNILNRKLGLKPGEEPAFTNVYEKAGGDDALLHKVASAQAHQDQWKSFMALGINQQDITGMDAAHLAAEVLRRGGEQFNMRGAGTGLWADKMGVSSLMGVNGMRQAGSYSDADYAGMRQQFEQLVPKLAQKQQDLDAGTAARQKFDAAWSEDVAKIEKALLPLNDGFIKLAGEVTDWVTAFAGSDDLKHDLDMVSEGFSDVAKTLKQLGIVNDNPTNDAVGKGMDATQKSAWETGNWLEKEFPAYKAWRERNSDWLGPDSDGGVGTGTLDDRKPDFQSRVLDAIKQNESSGKAGAVNPASGAAGLYGLMPANAKGINVDDPVAARKAARKILDDQLKAFNGDLPKALAGYDGDTHVAADSKKYGDMWLKGAKPETIDYLKKIENQKIDIGLTPKQQKYIDDHTSVKNPAFNNPKALAVDAAATAKLSGAKNASVTAESVAKANADNPDNQAVDAVLDRLRRGFGMIGNGLREGGGASLRSPDAPRPAGNTQMAPYAINVTVTSPVGSSVNVTASSLAQ